MKINTPAMLLCFDDCHIGEWYDYLQFFDAHNMKVTFYITGIAGIRLCVDHGWDKLRRLQAHGHTIAYHGMHHLRAGTMIDEEGCDTFMAREIWAGLEILKDEGFDNIQHYCYPHGNRTEASDRCLWRVFRTLRHGGPPFYIQPDEIKNKRLIAAKNFVMGRDGDRRYKSVVEGALINKSIICAYMHKPMRRRLEWLSSFRQLNFLPMRILDVAGDKA